MISIKEARQIVREYRLEPHRERRALEESLGYYLAEDIRAPEPLPRFDNSAMDGFAVALPEGADHNVPLRLPVVGESRAGVPYETSLEEGTAARISTGAVVPEGTDLVVPVEDAEMADDQVTIRSLGNTGAHIRLKGEEVEEGAVIAAQRTRVTPPVLAWCATFGITELPVYARPRVAVLTTGHELIDYAQSPEPGQIRNSNQLFLEYYLRSIGLRPVRSARVPDSLKATEQALREAASLAEVILISGGVSVGRHDHVKEAAENLGFRRRFWKVAQKPGKPLYVASGEHTMLFGLPGNPVSTVMSTLVYVHPVLNYLRGSPAAELPAVHVPLSEPLTGLRSSRARFLLVQLDHREDGSLTLSPAARQRSHMLSGVTTGDGFLIVPPDEDTIKAGTVVTVYLFPWNTEIQTIE